MTKLIIFDLDGTLLNTIADLAASTNHALTACGHPERRLKEYNLLVGRGIANLMRGALPEDARSEEEVQKMLSIFVPYYTEHIADLTTPYPGIPELLQEASDKGIRLAIASNKFQSGTEILVRKFFPGISFVKILGQREGAPIKPDPQIVLEAMEAAGTDISREEVSYVGDSNVDMQTGINAGVRTIGVSWGFRTREELAAYNPYRIAEKPSDILD